MAKCGNGRKDPQPSVVSVATGRRLEHSSGFAKNLQSFAKKKDPGLPKWIHQALGTKYETFEACIFGCISVRSVGLVTQVLWL